MRLAPFSVRIRAFTVDEILTPSLFESQDFCFCRVWVGFVNEHQNLSGRYASSSNIWEHLVIDAEDFDICAIINLILPPNPLRGYIERTLS